MDWEIQIDHQTWVFEQHTDIKQLLDDKISYWNNFEPERPLFMRLRKIPSKTDTIVVNVQDEYNISEQIS